MTSISRELHAEAFLRYVFGILIGLIAGLFILHILHDISEFGVSHTFWFHWLQHESSIHASLIISSPVFLGVSGATWLNSKKMARIMETEVKTLNEISQTKTELISFVSHEMRSPISALSWSVRMLLDGDFGELSAEQRQILGKTLVINQQLDSLVSEFLDLSKIERETLEIVLKRMDLNALGAEIENVIERMRPRIEEKNLVLNLQNSIKNKNLFLSGDSRRIIQVVRNLLENAISYTSQGGRIELNLATSQDNFQFSISDTGIGIPQDEQSKIFGKFFRAINARKIQSTGTGIGLYLCKKFIEAHRGKIWFLSQEDKGTTFSFSIPLAATKIEEAFLKV